MNGEAIPNCSLHTKEVVVGVCSFCLKERLLGLVSNRDCLPLPKDAERSSRGIRRKLSFTLPAVFSWSTFHHRFESQRQKADAQPGPWSSGSSSSSSRRHLEDSFISMRFEEDGRTSWDCKRTAAAGLTSARRSNEEAAGEGKKRITSVVEHTKPRGMLMWHRKIGQLLQLARLKRSSKAGVPQAGGRRASARILSRRKKAIVTF